MDTRYGRWRSLAAALERDDFSSPYLDRVRDRAGPEHELRAVQREIVAEMAYALKCAERKVNEALLECDLHAAHWNAAASREQRQEHAAGFADARARARRAKWEYMVHREAIGLLWTDEIDREFPIPPGLEKHARALEA